MNEQEAIELLKHYRHRYANYLQLVISYAQLGKLDVVQAKAAELIEIMNQDQLFHNMPLPKTIITLMQLNDAKDGVEWTPIIDLDEEAEVDDLRVTEVISAIHQQIVKQSMNLSLYHGTITFQQKKSQPFKLLLACRGNFSQTDQLKETLSKIDRIQIERATNEELVFNWTAQ